MSQQFFTFEKESAMKADRAGIIDKGGNYPVTLGECYVGKTQNGARFIELNGVTANGERLNYVTMYTHGADGSKLFDFDKINALCGLKGLATLTYQPVKVEGEDAFLINEFKGLQIGIGVYRQDQERDGVFQFKENGQIKFAMKCGHFYDPKTWQTYTEKIEGKEAATVKRPVSDKLAPASAKPQQAATAGGDLFGNTGGFGGGFGATQPATAAPVAPAPFDDDLPF